MMIGTPSKDKQAEEGVWYGMTRWNIDDVKYLAPEWTDEQCHEFMERHDRHLKDRMIELGWEVLDLYVAQEKHLLAIRKGAKIRAMPHIEEGK
jgi:hypothetical protein